MYSETNIIRKSYNTNENKTNSETVQDKRFTDIMTEISVIGKLKKCKNYAFVDLYINIRRWNLLLRDNGVKKYRLEERFCSRNT